MGVATDPSRPFGRLLTAMVTPFDAAGALDFHAAAELAHYLVDEQGNDGLVINGTTGESATTSDEEKRQLLQTVVAAVGDRAHVVAGVGTADTEHSLRLSEQAIEAGATGLLVVTPYFSRPPRAGVMEHFRRIADASPLPVMIYDIPVRTGIAVPSQDLVELGEHERIVAVKDARGDLGSTDWVLREVAERGLQLAYYSGDDASTLAWLAVGGVGLVGTSTHFSGKLAAQLIDAFSAGDHATALALHRRLHPTFTGVFALPGCTLVKAGLAAQGRPVGGLRRPQIEASEAETAAFVACLAASGL